MPSSKSTCFVLAALAVVGPVAIFQPANALQAMGPPPVNRAEHIQLAHRMVRKRSTSPRVVPLRRQETTRAQPGSGSATTAPPSVPAPEPTRAPPATPSSPAPSPTTTSQAQTTSTSTSTSSTSTTSTQPSTTVSTTTRSTTSATSTASSSSQQATTTSNTSTIASATSQDTVVQAVPTQSNSRSTLLVTTTSTPTSDAQQTDRSKDEGASFLSKPVIVSLIVAACCVVGAAAIWTIIRKWKFGASRQFEDRLEPVNWEPPATTGLPMDERDPTAVAIARGNSVNSKLTRSSFGSSGGTHLGSADGRNMATAGDQPISVAPDFPPPHDFTAGASHMAPGSGYADLQRGPSPAPSMNYSGYGQQYNTPNPYDAYDYQGGYGGYGGVQQPPNNSGPGPHQF